MKQEGQEVKMKPKKKVPKTKQCNWCYKRKKVSDGYLAIESKWVREYFICNECNLIHDIF